MGFGMFGFHEERQKTQEEIAEEKRQEREWKERKIELENEMREPRQYIEKVERVDKELNFFKVLKRT